MLLVLAVLTGVLGMHALPPGGVPMAHPKAMAHGGERATVAGHAAVAGDATFAGHAAVAGQATVHCAHGGHGSQHLEHADGTCAAAGIGSPYAPPALTTAVVDTPAGSVVPAGVFAGAERGRAPPDLAELQLLRI